MSKMRGRDIFIHILLVWELADIRICFVALWNPVIFGFSICVFIKKPIFCRKKSVMPQKIQKTSRGRVSTTSAST